MIAACPKCQTRYRVEPERLGPDGARLRCSQCSAVFRVRLPGAPQAAPAAPVMPEPPAPVRQEAAAPMPVPEPAPPVSAPAAPLDSAAPPAPPRSEEAPRFDRERLVLVAHPNADACKHLAEALEAEGLQVLVAHDGVEAILSIQRALPRAVVLDAALPKMFGFQVCELVKRNESLRVTNVCLMGAIHKEDRYRRSPNEIYGADFYLEPPALPGALLEWLGRVGLPLRSRAARAPSPVAPDSAVERPAAVETPPPVAGDASPAHGAERAVPAAAPAKVAIGRIGVSGDPLSAERAQAERLARIIVSDIVLYNDEKFSASVRSGNVVEAMRDELEEGRALFRERIDARVREERDYLGDELLRVARARGMQ